MSLLASLFLLVGTHSGQLEPSKLEQCGEPAGWDKIAERDPRFVVFGELHGTQQAPDFVGRLACDLASKGQRILVAVELSAADDQKLQDAWELPVALFEKSLSKMGWRGRGDGVASEAMFAMLVRLHNLKTRGFSVNVVAFNGPKDGEKSQRFVDLPGQGPHEAVQADNIAQASNASDYDRVLVLVGNIHARMGTVTWRGVQFDPMAKRLALYGPTLSLNMRYAEGTSWNCVLKASTTQDAKPVTGDALDCGNHATRGGPNLGPYPFIELTTASGANHVADYDGFFWVGQISGSPPAVED